MPVVAQINVNFANIFEARNDANAPLGGALQGYFPIEDKSVTPRVLSEYCLYNRELEEDNFGLDLPEQSLYEGGFLTAGDKLNVKHSDLHIRNNLDVGEGLYTEYIYSRRRDSSNDGNYQNDRAALPRGITLTPNETESTGNYIKINTASAAAGRTIQLYCKRNTGQESSVTINSTSLSNGENVTIYSPLINISSADSNTGVINLSSFVNIANDTKIANDKFIVTASNGNTQIYGNVNIGNSTSYDKFTVASNTGNTVIEGTLSVTSTSLFKNSITLQGGASETFIINDGTTNKFSVDTTNGNTDIQGTLNVISNVTLNSNVTIAGNSSTNASAELFKITNGASDVFTVRSADGNTFISGTLNITGTTTINSDKFIVTASDGNTQILGNLSVGAGYNKFTVASGTGNTAIAGTLGVTGATSLSDTLNVTKATTLSDTLTVSKAATFSTTVNITGVSTLTNNLSFNNSTADHRRITNIRPVSRAEILDAIKTTPSTYKNDSLPVGSFIEFLFDKGADLIITGNKTLTDSDHDKTYVCTTNTGDITITCPVNLTVGLQVSFIRAGTGNVTFTQGSGATVNSALNFKKLAFQNSAGTVFLGQTNTYYLFGDLLP